LRASPREADARRITPPKRFKSLQSESGLSSAGVAWGELDAIDAGASTDANDTIDVRYLGEEGSRRVLAANSEALRDNEFEPLLVVEFLRWLEVAEHNLPSHLPEALTAELLSQIRNRELIFDTKKLAQLAHGSQIVIRFECRFLRLRSQRFISLARLLVASNELLPLNERGGSERL
jgi:hypothetical protein